MGQARPNLCDPKLIRKTLIKLAGIDPWTQAGTQSERQKLGIAEFRVALKRCSIGFVLTQIAAPPESFGWASSFAGVFQTFFNQVVFHHPLLGEMKMYE